jgi:hypothetical protein
LETKTWRVPVRAEKAIHSRNHLSGREYTRESTEIGIKIFIGGLFITRKSLGHPRE